MKSKLIEGLGWRKLYIGKIAFEQDVIITPTLITYRDNEPSKKYADIYFHTPLSYEEMQQYVNLIESNKALVIGTGFEGRMTVMNEAKELVYGLGIPLYVKKTPQAVALYNKLVLLGKEVVGIFHLTC